MSNVSGIYIDSTAYNAGIKIEEFRPDLINLDDVDSLGDSLDITNKNNININP